MHAYVCVYIYKVAQLVRLIPERAIMSVWERPWEANMEFSWFKLKVGFGSLPSTLAAFDTKPSSLPNSTGYHGPPAYINTIIIISSFVYTLHLFYYHHIIHVSVLPVNLKQINFSIMALKKFKKKQGQFLVCFILIY